MGCYTEEGTGHGSNLLRDLFGVSMYHPSLANASITTPTYNAPLLSTLVPTNGLSYLLPVPVTGNTEFQ